MSNTPNQSTPSPHTKLSAGTGAGPWRWSEDWSLRLPEHSGDFDGVKYADLSLYDANGKPVINIGVDHYDFEFDGKISPEHRAFIVEACNSYPQLRDQHAALVRANGIAEKALEVFAANNMTEENCATVELAGKRVRIWAKDALNQMRAALAHVAKEGAE